MAQEQEPNKLRRRTRKDGDKLEARGGRISYRRYRAEQAVKSIGKGAAGIGSTLWKLSGNISNHILGFGPEQHPMRQLQGADGGKGQPLQCHRCGRKVDIVNGQKNIVFPGR